MSKNPTLNRAHQRDWYARLKQDPVRWQKFLAQRKAYKQAKRDVEKAIGLPKAKQSVAAQVSAAEPHLAITWDSLYAAIVAG